jgi:RNA polymerase-binding transcription factor
MKAATKKRVEKAGKGARPAKAAAKPARPRAVASASKMSSKQLEGYKLLLLDKKKGLTEAYNKNKTYGRLTEDEGTQDLADKASSAYTKEFLYSLSNTDREVLQTVDEALMRIERGEFGTCAECRQELNRKRLEAVPWASHCVTCQEKIEKGLL